MHRHGGGHSYECPACGKPRTLGAIIVTLKYFIPIFFVSLFSNEIFAQGHIDHIKNQAYMKDAGIVDCKGEIDNQFSARVCANLRFQKSDSVLTLIYQKLLRRARKNKDKTQVKSIVQVQAAWRKLRDQHCGIVADEFGVNGGSQKMIDYMECLTEMTNSRINELKQLYYDLKHL